MHTLTIKDLVRSERLDRPTMAAVRGGWKTGAPAVNASTTTITASDRTAPFGGADAGSGVTQGGENRIARP